MGRHKNYDRETIAQKAMAVFWRDGFHGTSTQALVDAMGVNRFSVYAEFGNKQKLYEAALAAYDKDVVSAHFQALESPEAGLSDIEAMLAGLTDAAGQAGSELGCFMCNCATERAPYDPGSQRFVHQHVERIGAALAHALANAQKAKQIRADVDTRQQGQFLATLLMGVFVLLRAQVAADVVRATAQTALLHLRQLRA
jgi:TetR/AcrR family transcriptional repressor of nem operon